MAVKSPPTKLSREESRQQTRERLLATAREVFLERGFHAASVAEISARAGYTTGAIYSGFGGKDELFLELLDRELVSRADSQRVVTEQATFEQGVRAAARDLYRAGVRDPAMTPLVIEFWIYAKDKPKLRSRLRRLHQRQIGWIAEMLEDAKDRFGIRFALPTVEVARGGAALSRGIRLERLVDGSGLTERTFVQMFAGYVAGLTTEDPGVRKE